MSEQKTETWYFAWVSFYEIKPVQVISATDKTILAYANSCGTTREKPTRCAIMLDGRGFFRTWAEAKQFIVDYKLREVEYAKEHLDRAIEQMSKAEAMQEPPQ